LKKEIETDPISDIAFITAIGIFIFPFFIMPFIIAPIFSSYYYNLKNPNSTYKELFIISLISSLFSFALIFILADISGSLLFKIIQSWLGLVMLFLLLLAALIGPGIIYIKKKLFRKT